MQCKMFVIPDYQITCRKCAFNVQMHSSNTNLIFVHGITPQIQPYVVYSRYKEFLKTFSLNLECIFLCRSLYKRVLIVAFDK